MLQNAQHGKGGPDDEIALQDAKVTLEAQQSFYTQLVLLIRQMYQECRLVHADLSEYNILVHEVSSSVSNPCAWFLSFLGAEYKILVISPYSWMEPYTFVAPYSYQTRAWARIPFGCGTEGRRQHLC